MFIVQSVGLFFKLCRSVMLTLRPYGAGVLFDATNYKHCVPNGTGNGLLIRDQTGSSSTRMV